MTSEEHAKQIVVGAFSRHGWSRHEGTAIVEKEFETAVGLKVAFLYFKASADDPFGFVLSGEYQTEGRNAVYFRSLIRRDADSAKVREVATSFVIEADLAIMQSYAVRLVKDALA